MRAMALFRRLAVASTLATFALVTLGGLVRATKSGLGCGTDWPQCSGTLVPELENRALVIEYSHRVAAGIVVVLIGALAVVAWRHHRRTPALLWASVGALALVAFQALLGAVVVKLELEAASVVMHLVTAMALVAVLVYVTINAYRSEDRLHTTSDAAVARRASVAAGAVLVVLAVGSYVSGTPGAGLAFGDWPLMNGALVPDLSTAAAALHFAHRAVAALSGVVVVIVAVGVIRRRADLPLQARLAWIGAAAYVVEVAIGAFNVWSELNAAAVTVHLFVGSVLWATLVGVAIASRPAPVAAREADFTRRKPALDPVR
jgi:cytochrome c oxidase assembly protein subunit 15